jgi:hypothetical protein
MPQWRLTGMASKGESKRARLDAYLRDSGITLIDENAWMGIREAIAPVSDSYLRKLVRSTGLRMSPAVEGVSQDSFAELERTLIAMQQGYEDATTENRRKYRVAVITAKDHAKWALRKQGIDPARKLEKEEMLLWMLTWLENPALFSTWLAIRKRAAAAGGPPDH